MNMVAHPLAADPFVGHPAAQDTAANHTGKEQNPHNCTKDTVGHIHNGREQSGYEERCAAQNSAAHWDQQVPQLFFGSDSADLFQLLQFISTACRTLGDAQKSIIGILTLYNRRSVHFHLFSISGDGQDTTDEGFQSLCLLLISGIPLGTGEKEIKLIIEREILQHKRKNHLAAVDGCIQFLQYPVGILGVLGEFRKTPIISILLFVVCL